MKILILGSTGFLGRHVVEMLQPQHQIMALVRHPDKAHFHPSIEIVQGDACIPGPWQEKIPLVDAVINLAGRNIAATWTREMKHEIYESRVTSTRNVAAAFPQIATKKQVLLNVSAIGYYGFHGDEWLTEDSPAGHTFLGSVCQDWEEAARIAEGKGVHVVIPRLGVVLGPGGALERMVKVFRHFLGSQLGDGSQWFSWIHLHDALLFIQKALEGQYQGIYNVCSPNPIQNRTLTKILSEVLGVHVLLHAPTFAIKLALGEFSSVVLNGQRVQPKRLLEEKFPFTFPELRPTLLDLLSKVKQ